MLGINHSCLLFLCSQRACVGCFEAVHSAPPAAVIWRNLPGSDSQVVQPFSDLGSYRLESNKSVRVVHVFQLSFGLGMFWILYAYDACGPSRQTSSILDTCRVEGPWKALDCRFVWLPSSWPVTWESLVIDGTSTKSFRTFRYTNFG